MCWRLHPCLLLGLLSVATLQAEARSAELPPPVDIVRFLPDTAGDDIGLPMGATSAYALGRSLLLQGETEAGLMYLNRAYQLAPESWQIATFFAQGLAEGGYVVDAARVYGELVAMEPDSLRQRLQYALLLAQSRQPQPALTQVRELQRRGESGPELVKLQADLLGQLDRVEEAIEVYRQAGQEDPANAADYYLAAAALMQHQERFAEMAELLQEGLDREPTSRPLRVSLLRYLVHQGQIKTALREARAGDLARQTAGLTRQPDCSLELADLLARQGQVAVAADVLASLLQDGERDEEVQTRLARFRIGLGQFVAAERLLTATIESWPNSAEAHYLLGRAFELQDEFAAGMQALRQAVSLDPGQTIYKVSLLRQLIMHHRDELTGAGQRPEGPEPGSIGQEATELALAVAAVLGPRDNEAHLILGYTFRDLGDLDRACRHFHLAGEVNETRVVARLELSICLQEAGQDTQAVEVLRALQAEYPDDPEVANNLGYFLAEQREDLLFAEQLVRQALRTDPQNGAYLDSLGWVFFQRGDFAEAFNWLVEAANQRPENPVILEHLALTLRELGKPAEALDLFRRALQRGGDAERLQALIAELEDGR